MTEEDKISVIEFEGCDYLGEVNEDMQPHGRGVLKSKDNFVTTNGWWKNGLLHGEATISKGYNKENEDEELKEEKGNYFEGDEHGTHSFTAFRFEKVRMLFKNMSMVH